MSGARPFIFACVVSASLHGFLLSQWPSPFVRVPSWASPEPMDVVYVPGPSQPSSAPAIVVSRAAVPPRSILRHPEQLTSRRAPSEPPPAIASPPPAPAPPPTTSQPSDPRPATPALLTLADFAQFHYKQMVRQRLRRAIRYPAVAGMGRGRVRLQITVARDGQVAAAACLDASAPRFEEATMEGVAALTDLPAFPPDWAASTVTWEFLVLFTPGDPPTVSP